MGAWLKHELQWLVHHLLSRRAVEDRGLLHWPLVTQLIEQHEANREDNTDRLLGLIVLELWCRMHLDGRTVDALAEELGAASRVRP
jgi:asparagine synthase (glutamine-hydrolysing)